MFYWTLSLVSNLLQWIGTSDTVSVRICKKGCLGKSQLKNNPFMGGKKSLLEIFDIQGSTNRLFQFLT